MREIEFRLDLVAVARCTEGTRLLAVAFARRAEIVPDFLGLVGLDFAGVALLVSNADLRQRLNDLLRRYLQFSG
jgi:hypothetical protein